MVYVNNKKFACESCIKGHRSSSCHHTDRPLFEIKKKGRPVSQCNKCRELRQSKKVHSKCTCDDNMDRIRQEQLVPLSLGSKSRRYIPIVPALPNGLKDVLESAMPPSFPADSRQRVDSLLNPCNCRSVWNCNCRASTPTSSNSTGQLDGLATLAHVAALRCCSPTSNETLTPASASSASSLSTNFAITLTGKQAQSPAKLTRSRPPSPALASRKRFKHNSSVVSHISGPNLPPIRISSPASSSHHIFPILDFDSMPSMSEILSFAGSGCTCGVQCSCPGCVQHRGSERTVKDHKDCGEGCGTCVDHSSDVLPVAFGGPTFTSLDQFLARAAALPPPPSNRRIGLYIDPTDISTFRSSEPHSPTINLPKLDCCGGQCLCPVGRCSCRTSCDGSCLADHHSPSRIMTAPSPAHQATISPRSCCAGKVVAHAQGTLYP